jgi:hypothetical protein
MWVRRQMELASGQALNLSIIWVGWDPNPAVSQITAVQQQHVMSALQKMRDIYGDVDIGIRRVYYTYVPAGEAGGYTFIDSSSEGRDLTDDWSAENDGLDVFWVPGMDPADGWGPGSTGTCDKGAKDEWTGVVCEIAVSEDFAGVLMAHEVGHYLGLGHGTDINNFMGTDPDGDGIGSTTSNSTGITAGQGNTMRGHCYVYGPCA